MPLEYGDTYETMVDFINDTDEDCTEDEFEKVVEYLNVLNKNGYSDFVWTQIKP